MSQTKVNSHLSITKLPCCRRQFQMSSRTHLIALFFVVTVAGSTSGQILSRPMSAMPIHVERCTVPLSIVEDHYHQPEPVPYRRYASTLTYGRALMGRASRENISCRGLRWDIFPLRSDYGSTSMAWVGLLKWAIYMWHSLLQV